MNGCCSICSELFNASDEIHATPCGHVFHHLCILQWFERSKSCPRCRKSSTERSLLRIYFDFSNTEGIILDAGALQAKLDSVEFDLKQKQRDMEKYIEEKLTIETLYKESEANVINLKEKMKEKSTAIRVLSERLNFMKKSAEDISKLEKDNRNLMLKLDNFKSLQDVITGSTAEVESLLKDTPNSEQLCTYIVMLKKSIIQTDGKKKLLQEKVRSLQREVHEINSVKNELQSKVNLLESSAIHFEDKYRTIEKEIVRMKSEKTHENSIDTINETVCNSPENVKKAIGKNKGIEEKKDQPKSSVIKEPSIPHSSSPYLSLKQNSNFMSNIQRKVQLSNKSKAVDSSSFYILKKIKSSENLEAATSNIFNGMAQKRKELETAYDGLGGHFKPDVFLSSSKSINNPLDPKKKRKTFFH